MANGDTDQEPGEEDRQRYDLYSEEEEQEIFDKMEELALAGELDDDSYRVLLDDYGLTPEDFTPPVNVGGTTDFNKDGYKYDDGYDLGRTEPPPNNSSDFDNSDDFLNASNPAVLNQGGDVSDSRVDGDSGSGGGGGAPSGGGSIYDVSDTTTTNTTPGGSGGGGMMEFPAGSGVYIPEEMLEQAKNLINQGVGVRNLANALGLESRNQKDVEGPVNMTDAEKNGIDDPNFTGEFEGQQYENGTLVSSDVSGDPSSSSPTGGSATGGESDADADADAAADASAKVGDIDVDAGDSSAKVGDIDVDAGDIYSDVRSEGGKGGQGGSGGNVSVNIEGDDGFDPNAFEAIKPYLDIYSSSSDPLEEGVMPKILPEATGSLGLVKDFAEGIDAINRDIGFKQAKTATDIYGQTISDVEDSQSSLFKSNVQQADQLGDQIDSLMGLDFLQQRDADQLGFGQAEALGRSLGSLGSMLAGRQRAEGKRENLRTASDLLGRKQSIAKDLASIQGSIYSQVAPNIGVDPGAVINIAGTDINNILRERGTRQLADATRESGKKDLLGNITGSLISKFL